MGGVFRDIPPPSCDRCERDHSNNSNASNIIIIAAGASPAWPASRAPTACASPRGYIITIIILLVTINNTN